MTHSPQNPRRFACAIALCAAMLLPFVPAAAQEPLANRAFKGGEQLDYTLFFNWKFVWFRVGSATLVTQRSAYRGHEGFRSHLITRTSSKADRYFVMRDTLTSYFTDDLVPYYYRKGAHEGKNYKVDEVWYSYPRGNSHVHQRHVKKDGTVVLRDETRTLGIYDMLTMVQRARSFDPTGWPKGKRISFLMTDGGKVEKDYIVYRGKKNFKMDDSKVTYRCLVFSFIENEHGRDKEIVTFYITDDLNHLPVRLDLNLKFGTAKAFLHKAIGVRNPQTSIVSR